MIRSLAGTVLSIEADAIILDVSGFGIEVFASGSLLSSAKTGEFLRCGAYLQVSDSGMAVFGFSDGTERALFLEITQVKTMGGKLSIALLRHLDAGSIIAAIKSGEAARLAVPGVGVKRAERICFELKSRMEKKFGGIGDDFAPIGGSLDAGVIAGLIGLGFSQGEALSRVSSCRSEDAEREWTEESLMMAALSKLQRRG
ncbi:Holliday junction ATP-dependent DNA helicase RuvA [Synergistales bacterium]|nr:Holliday junction ATP-dependent DNA helicase RuvA [Synergistales bacterium]GHV52251.1 Holliday junction ATP-dependent DNA helicase RuvA [Synergistales bacterium]